MILLRLALKLFTVGGGGGEGMFNFLLMDDVVIPWAFGGTRMITHSLTHSLDHSLN